MGGGAETKQADTFSWFHAGHAKAAKTDDAGAQQRGSMQVVQRRGQGKDEIRSRDREFRVSAVHLIAGEGRCVAEVFKVVSAVPANPVCTSDP
jgi:hypothetical protein